MRPTSVAAVGALGLLVLLQGCAGQENEGVQGNLEHEEPAPSGPAQPSPQGAASASADVFVYNTYGDERGSADREPEGLTASEFTTFTELDWSTWSDESAEGEGRVSGTWCLPECQDDPYGVTVELHGPEDVDGRDYYTAYTLTDTGNLPEDMHKRMREADEGRLMLPSSAK